MPNLRYTEASGTFRPTRPILLAKSLAITGHRRKPEFDDVSAEATQYNGSLEMFATIRRYEGVGRIDLIALAAREQFFPLFEKLPGFVSHTLIDIGDNTVMSVTIFETREQAEAGNTAVRELVQQILSQVIPNPATIVLGKVMAHLDRWP
jgi:hypothetical protein